MFKTIKWNTGSAAARFRHTRKKKNVYGNELIYPVCQDSIIFSYIAGTKTFCSITIANIKKLGYKFETQKEEI